MRLTEQLVVDAEVFRRVTSGLSHDQQMRVLAEMRRAHARKLATQRQERLLLKGNHTEKRLYCVAYEDWSTFQADLVYFHAVNEQAARYEASISNTLRGKRIVAIAPAVGVWVNEKGETSA